MPDVSFCHTPEFYKPCNCSFVYHCHIRLLKSVSRISASCGISHRKLSARCILYMLPFAPRWVEPHCWFLLSNVTQERLLDSYKFLWTRRDCCCAALLKVLKKRQPNSEDVWKVSVPWSSFRWGNRQENIKQRPKNASKSGACLQ